MGTGPIILTVAATFLAMEGAAWSLHKYVMHGFLWHWHQDHHVPRPGHLFERNDRFFLVFAAPSVAFFIVGAATGPQAPWTWMGLGMLLYGTAYFLVHEVFIHQRIKGLRTTNSIYFTALRMAHKAHHKQPGKAGGVCFGMLLVPLKYFREAASRLRQSRANG
jgi:beta-carotene 3-hydroxylase